MINNRDIIAFYLFFIILLFSPISCANINSTATFITFSDIHFDPFNTCDRSNTFCPIIDKLRNAAASEWKNIFAQYDTSSPAYGKETGFVLFESGLAELKRQAIQNRARFVLLLGDLLSHHYKETYQYYTGDKSNEGIQLFVDKSMQFIIRELNRTFPTIDVYPVVGNNDSYSEHYVTSPQFFNHMAQIWGQVIKNNKAKIQMQRMFAKDGYYAINIPTQKNLRLIVLNTTYFARAVEGAEAAAKKQLDWLHGELATLSRDHQKALIALHVPPGIDIYKTVTQDKVVEFWHDQYTKQFLAELRQYASHIMGVFPSHTHADWFQLMKADEISKTFLITSTSSISPQYGNNPAFKIYYYTTQLLSLENYVTYFYPLDENKLWRVGYDFNKTYQPNCSQCKIMDGMNLIQPTGELADKYRKFYSVDQHVRDVINNNNWKFYWCATKNMLASEYMNCINAIS